ncbi:nucleolar MIF4G domain-containing protein 1 homolog isoform X2 [Drosophila subobscura]|uniref:nucleolar MIF4G domain-containing protein 1 homolog isoform X2 n=1 Tax=Drosophila subobscura TaxID=7241 RepID=UPI00155A6BE1|nr:nucleolar MIF4G domain-containing protein 1 homolog isoform X2 [Drosophila subobscura]
MSTMNILLILWCAVMLMQPGIGQKLRVKRSPVSTLAVHASNSTFSTKMLSQARSITIAATPKMMTTKAVATTATPSTVLAYSTGFTAAPTTKAVATTNATTSTPELVANLMSELQSARRRLDLLNDEIMAHSSRNPAATSAPPPRSGHRSPRIQELMARYCRNRRHPASVSVVAAQSAPPSPPRGRLTLKSDPQNARKKRSHALLPHHLRGFYSKRLLPDGKTEMEEFQLVAPKMTDDNAQQELDYEPKMVAHNVARIRQVKKQNGGHILTPAEYYQKLKTLQALPPMFDMAQMFQQQARIFDLIDHADDMTLRQLPKLIDSLLKNGLGMGLVMDAKKNENQVQNNEEKEEKVQNSEEKEENGKHGEEKEDKEDNEDNEENEESKFNKQEEQRRLLEAAKKNELKNASPNREDEEEFVISCPVRHDHHANRYGEIVDDDVVLVDQCHVA